MGFISRTLSSFGQPQKTIITPQQGHVDKAFFQACLKGDAARVTRIIEENEGFLKSTIKGVIRGFVWEGLVEIEGEAGPLGVLAAIYGYQPKIAELLFDAGVSPRSRINDNWNSALLHKSVVHFCADITQIILDRGEDPDVPDKAGMSPLQKSVSLNYLATPKHLSERLRAIDMLCDKKADINHTNGEGWMKSSPPVFDAAYHNRAYFFDLKPGKTEADKPFVKDDFILDPKCPALQIIDKLKSRGASTAHEEEGNLEHYIDEQLRVVLSFLVRDANAGKWDQNPWYGPRHRQQNAREAELAFDHLR